MQPHEGDEAARGELLPIMAVPVPMGHATDVVDAEDIGAEDAQPLPAVREGAQQLLQ